MLQEQYQHQESSSSDGMSDFEMVGKSNIEDVRVFKIVQG